jgi:hypothetical protein
MTVAAAVGVTLLASGVGTDAASPEAGGGTEPDEPLVFLYGPAGRLAGTPVDRDAPIPEGVVPRTYDTAGRDPSLQLQALDPDLSFTGWRVVASPLAPGGGTPIVLAGADMADAPTETVALEPPPPGDWLVRASLVPADPGRPSLERAWHVRVPDRSLPDFLPEPDVVLFGGGSTILGVPGSGCYVGVCGDIGREPPSQTLPRLRLDRPDEPLTVTLSDGAAIAAIRAAARPIGPGGEEGPPTTLLDLELDRAESPVLVPPPGPGLWRIELLVRFDFERGHQTVYARLRVP